MCNVHGCGNELQMNDYIQRSHNAYSNTSVQVTFITFDYNTKRRWNYLKTKTNIILVWLSFSANTIPLIRFDTDMRKMNIKEKRQ